MSDSSTGQIVGAIAGFAVGGPTGASIGYTLGGIADPPPGPNVEGPRLSDLSAQTAGYGVGIADIDGKVALHGNVFWVEGGEIKEVVHTEDTGGKGGGGGGESTTYKYYGTFAVALTDHQIQGLHRLWVGPDLVVNIASDDLGTIVSGGEVFPLGELYAPGKEDLLKAALQTTPTPGPKGEIRLYPGFDDQMPDPRMEAELGVGNCPAYRGVAYLMFYDWPLEKYQNSIAVAQVKVEAVEYAGSDDVTLLSRVTVDAKNNNGEYQDPFCVYLRPEVAVISHPQWDDNESTSRPARLLKTRVGFSSYSAAAGILWDDPDVSAEISLDPPFGRADRDVSYVDHGWDGPFTYGAGHYDETDEQLYRFDVNTLYNMNAQTQVNVGELIYAIAQANDLVYLLLGSDIKIYDASLVLQGTYSHGIPAVEVDVYSRMFVDKPFLYVSVTGTSSAIDALYAQPLTSIGSPSKIDLSAIPGTTNTWSQVDVEGSILSGAYLDRDNGTFVIERWRLPALTSANKPLATVARERMERSELIEPTDINVSLLTDTVRGCRTSGIQSIRSKLQPLMDAYQFDVIPDGYQIKCVPRGQSSVMTVDYDHLDARPYGSKPGVAIDQQREMDTQLPRKVIIKHLDAARDYDVNQQESVERQSSATVNLAEKDFPIVFTPDEAAGIADTLMDRAWLERDDYKFTLPPIYNALQPADVITVAAPFGTLEFYLGKINYLTDGRLECEAKLNDSALYTPNAVGGTGAPATGTIPFAGDAVMALLDIPLIQDQFDYPGYAAALCGFSDSWPGGVITRSTDNGQSWKPIQGFSYPVTMGLARDSLADHACDVIDRDSTLTVDFYSSDMSISSITEAQMLTGMNWFAYGVDGRWEVGLLAGATLNADGSYTFDTFIRGAKGSEWAAGLHEDYDTFVFLSDADMAFVGADLQNLGVERLYRGVTTAQDIDAAADTAFTYNGMNLKPLAPAHLAGVLNVNDWDLSWVRRTRLSQSWWNTGVEVPLGETAEAYEIDIMNGSTVVRTLTATTNEVTYTSADQVTDFGSNQSTLTFRVYQMSATVGRGLVAEVTV